MQGTGEPYYDYGELSFPFDSDYPLKGLSVPPKKHVFIDPRVKQHLQHLDILEILETPDCVEIISALASNAPKIIHLTVCEALAAFRAERRISNINNPDVMKMALYRYFNSGLFFDDSAFSIAQQNEFLIFVKKLEELGLIQNPDDRNVWSF